MKFQDALFSREFFILSGIEPSEELSLHAKADKPLKIPFAKYLCSIFISLLPKKPSRNRQSAIVRNSRKSVSSK